MKSSHLLRSSLCIAALALASIASNASAQIQNGSFESGDFTNWNMSDTSGNTNIGPVVDLGINFAHSGTRYANLGASLTTGTLSQTFNTIIGQTYSVSFWLANDSDGTGTQFFNILFDGVVIGSVTSADVTPNPNFGGYTQMTFSGLVPATSNSMTLQFQSRNDQGYYRLDDVVVSVVPEPSTISCAVVGLSLLGLYFRARGKARRSV